VGVVHPLDGFLRLYSFLEGEGLACSDHYGQGSKSDTKDRPDKDHTRIHGPLLIANFEEYPR
jgi:hypothetical protein